MRLLLAFRLHSLTISTVEITKLFHTFSNFIFFSYFHDQYLLQTFPNTIQ